MPSVRSSHAVAWIVVLLHGVVTLVFHGFILCVGADDHVALELTTANDCCPPRSAVTTVGGTDCSGCTDASLLQPMVERRSDADIAAAGMSLATAAVVTPAAAGRYRRLLPPRSLAPPGDLARRRTVVLLL